MLELIECRDKSLLEEYFRRNTAFHLYALADLDEPFWNDTRWYCAVESSRIHGVVLVLTALDPPIVYAICEPGDLIICWILQQIEPLLPKRFFAHVGLGVINAISGVQFDREGEFYKMILADKSCSKPAGDFQIESETAYEPLREFYDRWAYGDDLEQRFFEPYMIQMSPYHVIKHGGRIVAAAGVHVASDRYSVAALGNIATAPKWRGRGFAMALTASLCLELASKYRDIGLNVRMDNAAAVNCYRKIGFRSCLKYEEGIVTRL